MIYDNYYPIIYVVYVRWFQLSHQIFGEYGFMGKK